LGGTPQIAGVKFNIVPESATRQVGLASGQYAMLPNIDAVTALQLKGRPGVALSDTLELAYSLVGMNTAKPPFDNPKVREALNTALNRQEIVEAALFGAGQPGGPLSPALKAWALDVKEFPCYRHDPARAQMLLKDAGVPLPVAVTMNVLPRQDIKDIAQVVQAQLNKAGFKVEIEEPGARPVHPGLAQRPIRPVRLHQRRQRRPGRLFLPHLPDRRLDQRVQVRRPGADKLLDSARASQDPAARKSAYDEVQRRLACSDPSPTSPMRRCSRRRGRT
jgi:peptide/nickel transport system substrate-binding protein